MSTGKSLLLKGSPCYRPRAAKSENKGYVRCIWIASEFNAKNATGKNGHEDTDKHKKFLQIHKKITEAPKEGLKRQQECFTKAQMKLFKIKHFEYKFLGLCLCT